MKFYNICPITEDIYLKLGVYLHYPKSNKCCEGRQFKKNIFFFSELCPFFDLDIFPLSSTPRPCVGTDIRCFFFSVTIPKVFDMSLNRVSHDGHTAMSTNGEFILPLKGDIEYQDIVTSKRDVRGMNT